MDEVEKESSVEVASHDRQRHNGWFGTFCYAMYALARKRTNAVPGTLPLFTEK